MPRLTPIAVENADGGDSRWRRMARVYGPGHTICFALLVVWIVVCGTYLATSDTPWESTITRRLEAGRSLKDEHVRTIALWWGAAVNLGGALVLALATPMWARRVTPSRKVIEPVASSTRVDWAVTIGLLLLVSVSAGVLRASRLDHSFTNDEEYAWHKNGHGYWKADTDGKFAFKEASWTTTLLTNKHMNNHTLQTAASRASNLLWQWFGDRKRPDFSEVAARMPSFVAGIASVFLLGILGTMAGGARVGVGAAVMLALSPWLLRYGAEARGYSLMILLVIASLLSSIVAIDRRHLRWWLLFGVCQAGYMLAFPAAVFIAVAHCVLVFITILGRPRAGKLVDVARFLGAGVLSVMLFLGTQALAIQQLAESVGGLTKRNQQIGVGWLRDTVSHLVAGIPWNCAPQSLHNGMSARLGWDAQPYYAWVIIVVFPLIAVLGLGHMVTAGWKPRLAALPVVGAGVLAVLHGAYQGTAMYGWYVVYLTIPFSLCVSWAADRVATRRTRHFAWFLLLTLSLYAVTVAEPLQRIGHYQRQPIRQVVEAVRGHGYTGGDPDDAGCLTATFGTSARQVLSYDPRVRLPGDISDLEELLVEAGQSGKSLVVYFCDEKRAASEWPELLARVTESPDFEKVDAVKGLEAMFRYSIYRWNGGPAK